MPDYFVAAFRHREALDFFPPVATNITFYDLTDVFFRAGALVSENIPEDLKRMMTESDHIEALIASDLPVDKMSANLVAAMMQGHTYDTFTRGEKTYSVAQSLLGFYYGTKPLSSATQR